MSTAEQMLTIVTAVKHDWFGINLDTGNFRTPDPYGDLAKLAPYAVVVQIKTEVHPSGGREEGWKRPDLVVNRATVFLGWSLGAVLAFGLMIAAGGRLVLPEEGALHLVEQADARLELPLADACFQVLDALACLDHLAHELVAEDVALLHGRHVAVVQVEVGAADRGRADLHDRVAVVQDLGVGDLLDLHRVAA